MHAGAPGLSFSSTYSVMPLLSTRIFPYFESASATGRRRGGAAAAPRSERSVASVGAAVVFGDVSLLRAGLELLEHAASAIAATRGDREQPDLGSAHRDLSAVVIPRTAYGRRAASGSP